MTIKEFSLKYNFKHVDKDISEKMYSGLEMSEEEWIDKLRNEFVFDSSNFSKIKPNVVIVAGEIKNEKSIQEPSDFEEESDSDIDDKTTKPTITKEEKLAKIKSKTKNKK